MKYQALSDAKVRGKLEPGRHSDGRGLVLWVSAQGTKTWQLRYRLGQEQNTFTIGRFPDVSLAEARRSAEKARGLVAHGIAPGEERKARIAQREAEHVDTFEKLAREWINQKGLAADSQRVYGSALAQLIPELGRLPITDVDASTIRRVLDGIKARTTRKLALMIIRGVLDDAAEVDKISVNPVRAKAMKADKPSQLKGVRARKPVVQHRAALINPEDLGEFMARAAAYPTDRFGGSVATALRLLPMLPARPVELVRMRWDDVDLDAGEWQYHVTKTGVDHVLYLPRQAVTILRHWKAQADQSSWVFPSAMDRNKPIVRDALLSGVLNVLGYPRGTLTAHGFRASFRTLCRRNLGIPPHVLERVLSHKPKSKDDTSGYGMAYDRDEYLPERKLAAQTWADFLEQQRALVEPNIAVIQAAMIAGREQASQQRKAKRKTPVTKAQKMAG